MNCMEYRVVIVDEKRMEIRKESGVKSQWWKLFLSISLFYPFLTFVQ
jgi:hypothetical protein